MLQEASATDVRHICYTVFYYIKIKQNKLYTSLQKKKLHNVRTLCTEYIATLCVTITEILIGIQ